MNEFVYILINPSMPGLVKIGRTDRSPEDRARELSSTGVPSSFMVAYEHLVSDSRSAEAAVHAFLDSQGHRPSANREFFDIPLKLAVSVVSQICREYEIDSSYFSDSDKSDVELSQAADDYYSEGLNAFHGYGDAIQSYSKAFDLLELSYKLGNLAAAEHLSDIYLWGLNGRAKPEKALSLLHDAASKGQFMLYLKLAKIYLGVERDPEFEKNTEALMSIQNAVKCYESFFSNEITLDDRLDAVFEAIRSYSEVLGVLYPDKGAWHFLDRELSFFVQLAHDALLDFGRAIDGDPSSAKVFLRIISEIDHRISRSAKQKLFGRIFDGVDVASLRSLLRNLPEERVAMYELNFSAYIRNEPKKSSGFFGKILG